MITLPPLPLIDGCLVFDNSWLEKFQSCPLEAQLSGINKRIATTHRDGLNFGQACHTAMSLRYNACGSDKCGEEVTNIIKLALQAHFENSPESQGDHRNLAMSEAFIDAYNQMYSREPFDILKLKDGRPLIEKSFLSPFAEIINGELMPAAGFTDVKHWVERLKAEGCVPVFYSGRIDLGITDNSGNWVLDHKSGFQFGRAFTAEMSSTPQMRGYCWEFRNYFGELPRGYIINAFRVRPPTQAAQYDTSQLFRISGKDPDFQRIPVQIDAKQIDDWEQDTFGLIEEFLFHYKRGKFNRHKKSCVSKYGLCQYYTLCNEVAPEHQESYLASPAFMDNEWSALNTPTQAKEEVKV